MKTKIWFPGMVIAAAMGAAMMAPSNGYTQAPPPGTQQRVKQYQAAKRVGMDSEGQRVFDQNCARCHQSPDGFSDHIAGTIVRHMRVRANLSRHDEQVLLKYFNQ